MRALPVPTVRPASRGIRATLAAFAFSAGLVAQAEPVSCAGQPGSVTDPVGDANAATHAGVTYQVDLSCASVQYGHGQLTMRAAVASGFDPATSNINFYLDTDQDTATGGEAYGLGIDYIVRFGATAFTTGFSMSIWTGAGWTWTLLPGLTFEVFDDGFAASIPLSLIGGDDGVVDFVAGSIAQLSDQPSFTGGLDLTDVATSAAQSVPEPATAALALVALGGLAAARRRSMRRRA